MNIIPIQAPIKVSDWKGLHVKSLRAFANYYMVFPKGTVFNIATTGPKKYLESLPCKCCGISGRLSIKQSKKEFLLDFDFVEIDEQ